MMKKFVQESRRTLKGSGYKGRFLIEEFKREMNDVIRQKLIELEQSSRNIEQWYERATNFDKH